MAMKQALEQGRVKNQIVIKQELMPLEEARMSCQSNCDIIRTISTCSKTSSSSNKIIKTFATSEEVFLDDTKMDV